MYVDDPGYFFTIVAVFVVFYTVASGLVSIAAHHSGRAAISFFFTMLLLGGALFCVVGALTRSALVAGIAMFLVPLRGLIMTTSDER